MLIKYETGVKVPAGWRQVSVIAEAITVSPKMCKVVNVISIDGDKPSFAQSRTGAKRQEFNGRYWANEEIGKRKRISTCEIVE